MKKPIRFLAPWVLLFSFHPVFAAAPSCQDRWVDAPRMEGNVLKSKIESTCQMVVQSAPRLSRLKDYFVKKLTTGADVVSVRSQEQASFEGLPGALIDSVSVIRSAEGNLTVRYQSHVVTNDDTQLLMDKSALEIKGDGNAGFTRGLGERVEIAVKPSARDTSHSLILKFTNITNIEKPWYAPVGIFLDKAGKGIKKGFLAERDKSLTTFEENL